MAGAAASMATKIACMVLVCMVVVTPHVEAIITCGQVVNNLIPCLKYLTTGQGPSPKCCAGVRTVNGLARTTPDRKIACGCLKKAAANHSVGSGPYVGSLASRCGVSIPYKISSSTDCNKIK